MKIAAVILLSSVLLLGCSANQRPEEAIVIEEVNEDEVSYSQIAVKRGNVKSEISINCQYAPKEKITCAFTGQEREIVEVLVEKGDFVEAGQVLARQNVEEYEELIYEEQHAIEMENLTIAHLTEMNSLIFFSIRQEKRMKKCFYRYLYLTRRESSFNVVTFLGLT